MSCTDTTANPSASDRRRLAVHCSPAVADVGCLYPRPKLLSFLKFTPSTKPQLPNHHHHHHHHHHSCSSSSSSNSKAADTARAVTVDSTDPYTDFRDSMLEMIVEMGIYRSDELRRLLGRYLELNSPSHCRVIVRAFADAHRAAFGPRSLGSPASDASISATTVVSAPMRVCRG
uniref:Transcription repressor n=1 Tax=Ananas comosus var. bracteatus TaxID=296719 RepID=A0A6V7P238_ANACO|nr:unnamed protein product [Ananas comosus var. bracteatus]